MDLIIKNQYKSLENISWHDVPKFCVITGKNGAGKSQLLELINSYLTTNQREIVEFNTNDFKKDDMLYLTSEWQLGNLTSIGLSHITSDKIRLVAGLKKRIAFIKDNLKNKKNSNIETFISELKDQKHYTPEMEMLDKIILQNDLISKSISDSGSELQKYIPSSYYKGKVDFINPSGIVKRIMQYRYDWFDAIDKQTVEQFSKTHPHKPWDIINNLLCQMNLNYYISTPEDLHITDEYTLQILNKTNNTIVNISDLSSGEKVLMSLVFWLFNSQDYNIFPKLLLLDEPDAHLHPSMTKDLINTLYDIFSKQYDVQVILTTHSPSTVAMAPEDSLYIMCNANEVSDDNKRIKKAINKDQAIKELTIGIPSLSINYDNRRQVVVESKNDVKYYDKLYQILNDNSILEKPEVSLNFINSGIGNRDGMGNCSQVKKICKIFKDAGNTQIVGIIDSDQNNKEGDNLFVLGNGERYSIENYIFDPLLVAGILLREKILAKDFFGKDNTNLYKNLDNLEADQYQKIIDILISKMNIENLEETQRDTIEVEYNNDKKLRIPSFILTMQGHKLEKLIIDSFPELEKLQQKKEELLKLEIIKKVIDDHPNLISKDIVSTFNKIKNYT